MQCNCHKIPYLTWGPTSGHAGRCTHWVAQPAPWHPQSHRAPHSVDIRLRQAQQDLGWTLPLFWAHWLHDREGSHEHSQRPPLPFLQKPNRPETISQILCFSLLSVDFKKLKYRMLGKCHLNTLIFQLLAYNIEGFVFMTIRKDCKTFSFLALADTSHSYQFKSLDLHLAH